MMSYAARAACSIRPNSLLSKAVAASYGSAAHMDPTSSFTLGVRVKKGVRVCFSTHSTRMHPTNAGRKMEGD